MQGNIRGDSTQEYLRRIRHRAGILHVVDDGPADVCGQREHQRLPCLALCDPQFMLLPVDKEFDILELLARNKGQVFSKEQIYDQVWGENYFSDSRNIIAYINKIRKKIEPDPAHPSYILTVWGIGYNFNEKIE